MSKKREPTKIFVKIDFDGTELSDDAVIPQCIFNPTQSFHEFPVSNLNLDLMENKKKLKRGVISIQRNEKSPSPPANQILNLTSKVPFFDVSQQSKDSKKKKKKRKKKVKKSKSSPSSKSKDPDPGDKKSKSTPDYIVIDDDDIENSQEEEELFKGLEEDEDEEIVEEEDEEEPEETPKTKKVEMEVSEDSEDSEDEEGDEDDEDEEDDIEKVLGENQSPQKNNPPTGEKSKSEYKSKEEPVLTPEEQEKKEKEEQIWAFKLMKKRFPERKDIPEYDMDDDLEVMKSTYERLLREISLDEGVESYLKYLKYGFLAVEMLGQLLDYDMQGFGKSQMEHEAYYRRCMIELGEKSKNRWGINLPVEIKLFGFIAIQAVIFYFAKHYGININELFSKGIEEPEKETPKPAPARKMKGPSVNIDDL